MAKFTGVIMNVQTVANSDYTNLISQAKKLYQNQKFIEAEALLRVMIERDYDTPFVQDCLAYCLIQQQKYEDAIKILKKIAPTFPNESAPLHLGQALFFLAHKFSHKPQAELNMLDRMEIIEIRKEIEELYQESASWFEVAVMINKGSHIAYFQLGGAYYILRKYSKAQNAYEKALSLSEDCPQIMARLGDIYLQQRDIERAIQAYKSCIVKNYLEQGSIYFKLASALLRANKRQEALEILQTAAKSITLEDMKKALTNFPDIGII